MNLLAAEESGIGQFGAAFLHAVGLAAAVKRVPRALEHDIRPLRETGDSAGPLRGAGRWLSWLAATASDNRRPSAPRWECTRMVRR